MLAGIEEKYNISVTSGCEGWQTCPGEVSDVAG